MAVAACAFMEASLKMKTSSPSTPALDCYLWYAASPSLAPFDMPETGPSGINIDLPFPPNYGIFLM